MSKNKNQPVKGYKVFNPDWTCNPVRSLSQWRYW